MRNRRPTIDDVARRAGVSKGAVSFALNGRPGVGADTRVRILAAAQELGWHPSNRGRALSHSKAFALGLVIARDPELVGADPFFPAFIAGVETELALRGHALVLQVAASGADEVEGYRRLGRDARVDGVFLTDLRHRDDRLVLLQQLGIPAVTLGRPDIASPFPSVVLDDRAAIIQAVTHLVELGHRRIAHVAGPPRYLHGSNRRTAWAEALAASGLAPGPVVVGDFTPASGAAATRILLGSDEPPTAIVYANDLMAIAGLTVAHELGIAVPEQLSITGFDDTQLAAYVHPPLTTAALDAAGWGRAATRTLLELIDAGHAADKTLPPARLVVRSSTAPLPAGEGAPTARAAASPSPPRSRSRSTDPAPPQERS